MEHIRKQKLLAETTIQGYEVKDPSSKESSSSHNYSSSSKPFLPKQTFTQLGLVPIQEFMDGKSSINSIHKGVQSVAEYIQYYQQAASSITRSYSVLERDANLRDMFAFALADDERRAAYLSWKEGNIRPWGEINNPRACIISRVLVDKINLATIPHLTLDEGLWLSWSYQLKHVI